MNSIIFGASTLKIYISQPFIFFFLSCRVTMYFRGLKAASDKIVLQKKKNVSNEFHGMIERSAEYVLDYTQIKKRLTP